MFKIKIEKQIVDYTCFQSVELLDTNMLIIPRYEKGIINDYLIYEVKDMVSLRIYLEMMPMTKKVFISILSQFLDFLRKLDELSWDSCKAHFDLNHVYVVPSIRKLQFIYVPIEGYTVSDTADDFLRNLVQYATFSEYGDNSYINEFISIINRDDKISMYDLSVYLSVITNGKICYTNTRMKAFRCGNCNALLKHGEQFCIFCGVRAFIESVPCIVRRKTQEKVLLDTSDLIIGKNRNECKMFVGDNPLVSRKHAIISSKNGYFYLMDIGSTNGTYLNGKRLQSWEEKRLRSDDKFSLANEAFVFYA